MLEEPEMGCRLPDCRPPAQDALTRLRATDGRYLTLFPIALAQTLMPPELRRADIAAENFRNCGTHLPGGQANQRLSLMDS